MNIKGHYHPRPVSSLFMVSYTAVVKVMMTRCLTNTHTYTVSCNLLMFTFTIRKQNVQERVSLKKNITLTCVVLLFLILRKKISLHAITIIITFELRQDKVASLRQPHLPDGVTVCVLNDVSLLMQSVECCCSLIVSEEQQTPSAKRCHLSVVITTNSLKNAGEVPPLLCKHTLCSMWQLALELHSCII